MCYLHQWCFHRYPLAAWFVGWVAGLWAAIHKNYWMDFSQTWMEDRSQPPTEPINFWWGSGSISSRTTQDKTQRAVSCVKGWCFVVAEIFRWVSEVFDSGLSELFSEHHLKIRFMEQESQLLTFFILIYNNTEVLKFRLESALLATWMCLILSQKTSIGMIMANNLLESLREITSVIILHSASDVTL